MKRKFSFLLLFLMVLAIYSCEKEKKSDAPPEIQLEYRIDPADNFITGFSYVDEDSKTVTLNETSQFPGGTVTITVPEKPFAAKLIVVISNTDLEPLSYTLLISVNDSIKAFKPFQVPPLTNLYQEQLEYTVR